MPPAARILVVDDEPHVREVLIQRLRRRDYEVDGAANGLEALDRIETTPYDVVVLDLLMPTAPGSEVLRALEARTRPRVIVLSGLATIWRRHNPDAKAFAVLEKPADFDKLVSTIDSALSSIRGEWQRT